MKNTLTIGILICCLSILLIGCNIANEEKSSDTQQTTETEAASNELESTEDKTESTPEDTLNEETTETSEEEEPIAEIEQLYFYSLTEYNKFLNSGALPESFVEYEDVKFFGEFYGIVFLKAAYEQDYSEYFYTFADDKNSTNLGLYVYENGNDFVPPEKHTLLNVDSADLRTVVTDQKRAEYKNGDYEYFYLDGKLQSITWTSGGTEYILSSDKSYISQYELKENDVISKLLTSRFDELSEIAIFKDAVADK